MLRKMKSLFKNKIKKKKLIEPKEEGNTDKEQAKQKEYPKEQLNSVFKKLLKESSPNWKILLCGCLTALLCGFTWPLFNIAFSNILPLLASAETNGDQINNYCLLFLGIALLGGFANFAYQASFGIVGERLVYDLRIKLFKKLLKMPIAFYDKK
eukprot:GHVR01131587.1.p1 GENE.GHVR01131587.1~~GHVR01131587.1.p1  ORF type:complete len:154 (+),score=12.42 GHVR01131587.1:1850-2311(+)